MKLAKTSPAQSTPASPERASPAGFVPELVDADSLARPVASGALAYQALLEDRLAEEVVVSRYPRAARAAIMVGGGVAAWAVIIFGARVLLGLFV